MISVVNGQSLYWRMDGPADAPVAVLAHSLGGSHRLWDWQMPALAGRWRVLRYDLAGHGDSAAPTSPPTLERYVADAVGVMDAAGVGQAHWVGLSLGGMIGHGLALAHGDRLLSLALCNTAALAGPWYRENLARREKVAHASGMAAIWEMTKTFWFTPEFLAAEDPVYRSVRKVFLATSIAGYVGGAAAVAELAYLARLSGIRTSTAVIASAADPIATISHAEAMADCIPGAALHVVEGYRHFSNVEAPAAFNACLLPFLEANRAA